MKKQLFIFLFTIVSTVLYAQESDSTKLIRDTELYGLPLLFYTPETGWGGGAAGGFSFLMYGEKDDGRRSQIQLDFAYTLRNQLLVFFPFRLYWNESIDEAYGELGYRDFSDRFYPIGNQHSEKEQKHFEETYRFSYPRIRLNFLRGFHHKHYFGGRYWFDNLRIPETEEGGLLASGEIAGSRGGIITGVGAIYQYDTRDHINFATKGTFFEGVLFSSEKWMGSDFRHQRIYLDYRRFIELREKHILALNAYGRMNFGTVPFDDLALFGGAKRMRGYFEGFYRDMHMAVVQAEYRFPIYWRFGGVAFTSFGALSDKLSNFQSKYIRPSGGVGLRFMLVPHDKLNIRADFGMGRNTSGFYLTVNEAF